MLSQFVVTAIIGCVILQQSFGVIASDVLNNKNETINDLSLSSLLNSPDFESLSNLTNFVQTISHLGPKATTCKLCKMNTAELCEYNGYKSESFTHITLDEYNLTIFRCYKHTTQKQPVLLVHGMMDSSDTWALNRGNKSLAYSYVEQGYDVYMINCRGNRYSRRHITLDPDGPEFWNFSWQEMALFDVPEVIDVVRQRTGSSTVQCVGHSQGGSVLLALLSLKPEYNKIITHVGLLAPFTQMQKIGFPINTVIKAAYNLEYQRNWEFLPHTYPQEILARSVCKVLNGRICNWGLNFILGPSINQLDGDLLPVIFCHFPAGCSSKQLWHFGQEYHCNYFGLLMDLPPPKCADQLPRFNLSLITTNAFLFYSPTDPHTNEVDVAALQKGLLNANLITKKVPQFNHIDFIWGKNAGLFVYKPLIARATNFAT